MSDDDHEEGGHERWLVSYADFMTLLFAFFTVLYATSEKNVEKTQEFQESVKRYLIKAGGGAGGGGGAPQINQGQLNNSVIEPPIKTYRDDKTEANAPVMENAEAFVEGLPPAERKAFVADLNVDEWGVRMVLPSRRLFASGDDHFKPEALAFLKRLAALLAKSDRKILIEGHVGEGEVGSARSTWDFAAARAANVLRVLQRSGGLTNGKLAMASLGDSRARIPNGGEANSRIEIVMLNAEIEF